MVQDGKILMGVGEKQAWLYPGMANRHGLIAGASGTGKTITLKVMAESFSMMGTPVFLADVKGDLAGMCRPGEDSPAIRQRLDKMGITDFEFTDFPTCFWDIYGQGGHPVRTTVSEMGPLLLSRLMGLTDVQQGVLNIVFRVADDQGMLVLDLKDLKAMLKYVGDNRAQLAMEYGNVSPQSVGAIQRALLALEDQGADQFFGEPALDIFDWMRMDARGRGYINILDCRKLFLNPQLYAAFMLFLLSELFERLPEAGDLDKPKMVFFFDEAHLLFKDAPKALVEKIEQVVKLIRSKGVGIYFITQSPSDIPDTVLAQLSGRVQHALRAYTPAEQRAIRAAALSFRINPAFSTQEAITQLGVGEALVSFLDNSGVPSMVERAFILPPQSLMGPVPDSVRYSVMAQSPVSAKYDKPLDRESAYEMLAEHFRQMEEERLAAIQEKEDQKREKELEKQRREEERLQRQKERERAKMLRPITRVADSMLSSVGRQLGRSIVRGLFGNGRG